MHIITDSGQEEKYEKLGNAGIDGILFQIDLIIVFLLNAIVKQTNWRLSTEDKAGHKFDDIIFQDSGEAVLLQAKYRQSSKITKKELYSTNSKHDDFSLAKYFFSYQRVKNRFKIRNVIICTNAELSKQVKDDIVNKQPVPLCSESMLYFGEGQQIYYTFRDDIIEHLKKKLISYYDNNLQKKEKANKKDEEVNKKDEEVHKKDEEVNKEDISDENIRQYLSHLQFISTYPYGKALEEIIKTKFGESEFGKHLKLNVSISKTLIYERIMDWFREKNGNYLNKTRALALFYEIISNQHCEVLHQYNIYFENNVIKDSCKNILHIVPQSDYLISLLKVYRALQHEKILLVAFYQDVNVQNRIMEAFQLPTYKYLIIVSKMGQGQAQMLSSKLKKILSCNSEKKVILISEEDDKLAKSLKNVTSYELVRDNIKFSDLSCDTRKMFLDKDITFQGTAIKLSALLSDATEDDLNKVFDMVTLSRIVTNKEVKAGKQVKLIDKKFQDFYIARIFKRENNYFLEKEMAKLNEKVILISDTAGMGKSFVLMHLAEILKSLHPELWVILLDLNGITNILEKIEAENMHLLDVLKSLNFQKDEHEKFEENLYSLPGKVVLLIDGMDEIIPNYRDVTLKLILESKLGNNFAKIFLTTRPHLSDELVDELEVKPFTLVSFTNRQQNTFLRKYWKSKLNFYGKGAKKKCKIYARKLIEQMGRWINEHIRNVFAGIPLQLRMLAEVFESTSPFSDDLKDLEGCEEYVRLKKHETPGLPSKFNLILLYKTFMQKKQYIFVHDKFSPNGGVLSREAGNEKFLEYNPYHYHLALETIFDKSDCMIFDCYKERNNVPEASLLKVGLIQKNKDQIYFVHRTFAEYFVAECLLNELKREEQNIMFQNLLIDRVLYFEKYYAIRVFIDNLLGKQFSLPQSTLKAYHSIDYNFKLCTQRESFLANILMHIRKQEVIINRDGTFLHILSREGCVNILQFLDRCLNCNTNFCALNCNKKININITNTSGDTPLLIAAKKGDLDVVKLFLEKEANLNENAINEKGRKKLQHESIDQFGGVCQANPWCININFQDTFGCTALCYGVLHNNMAMVKLLVERGADVNMQNKETLFASIQIGGNCDIIHWDCFMLGRQKDTGGSTSLHLAADIGNLDMVKFLIENGADINARDWGGCTALHIAARKNNKEMADFLAKKYDNVNIQDEYGCTPLHEAATRCNSGVYDSLVSFGASDNILNKISSTPLEEVKYFSISDNNSLKKLFEAWFQATATMAECTEQLRDIVFGYR